MQKIGILVLFGLAAAGSISIVHGVEYRLDDVTREVVTAHFQDATGWHSEECYAGEFKASSSSAGVPATLYTYCLDVGMNVSLGATYRYDVSDFSTCTGLDPLWSAQGGIQNAAFLFYQNSATAHGNAVQSAGLQVAIWEALYDSTAINSRSGLSLSSAGAGSRFWVSGVPGDVLTSANNYLAELGTSSFVQYTGTVLAPAAGVKAQTLFLPGGTPQTSPPVSAPDGGATWVLFGLALAGLAVTHQKLLPARAPITRR